MKISFVPLASVAVTLSAAVSFGQAPKVWPPVTQGVVLLASVPPTVDQLVSVRAVMLPYSINRQLFSKHIADHYAVVIVNIANRSHDAALVLEGIYLDYSKWALSGNVPRTDPPSAFSAATRSGQVSSVEYRIVRGELEERDARTVRSWMIRSLEFAGSLAGGTTFAYGAMSTIPKYISMASGVGIPGFEKLWPDSLLSRLNRISDFGYRVNRVVPRESSDVMIAFFPIDRFLTPKLKSLFIRQPALFFNTGLALMDPNPEMTAILERISGQSVGELTAQIPAMISCSADHNREACEKSASLREMVRLTSLNSIEIVVDGSLMLDLAAVAPVLQAVVFGQQKDFWGQPGAGKAVVASGRYLDGARLSVEPADLGIDWVSTDPANSNSGKLVGNLRFSKPVAVGQQLWIKVIKDNRDGQSLMSAPVVYTVPAH